MCPTLRRTAGPARSHCLRSARTRRVGRARRDGAGLPRGAPRPSRRSQRAQRALPEAGSVPCAAAHSRARSISPHAISADATRRPDDAGRCGTVVMGHRVRQRPPRQGRARAAQAARVPRAAAPPMALRRELAGEDERLAGRPPSVERVPHRDGTAASPTGARTARRRPGAGAPARERVLLGCSKGEINGKVGRGHESAPSQATTRKPSTSGCSPRVRSGLLPREDHASNLVGPVRGRIGLLGRHRPFRAVRHFRRKWATRTPSTLRRG